MYHHGWYQIAFERELDGNVCSAAVGMLRLVMVRDADGVRAFDAVCPHRGADLAVGGRFDGGALICPFHGFRIGLGERSENDFCVREYRTLVTGGLVFVQMSNDYDNGFACVIEKLGKSHFIMAGFTLRVRSASEMVIENAFDQAHFRPVHGIGMHGEFRIRSSESGELAVEGTFDLPPSAWQRGERGPDGGCVPFVAHAYSPGIVISNLGGAYPYTVITASTPITDGECTIRLSLALPLGEDGGRPRQELCDYLLRRSRAGLEKDRVVWEHRCETSPNHYTPLDEPVREFRTFCGRFAEATPHAALEAI
jgi:3-ketosteroid 9alpha-monooxygenase subunit A